MQTVFTDCNPLRNRLLVISLPHKVCKRTNQFNFFFFFIFYVKIYDMTSFSLNPSTRSRRNSTSIIMLIALTRSSLKRKIWGSNLVPVKSDTVLPTARHRCNISSKEAVLPRRNDVEVGQANSLHASAYCSEYTER